MTQDEYDDAMGEELDRHPISPGKVMRNDWQPIDTAPRDGFHYLLTHQRFSL